MRAYTTFSTKRTPQSRPIPGSSQIQNNAGGFAWAINDWDRLDRFLILGSEGGTYYVGMQQLTAQNAEAVIRCVQADGNRVVNRIIEISEAGRAPKNDPALFALAISASLGDRNTRQLALGSLRRVARIGTHLFNFCEYVQQFRGWGRLLRSTVADWYLGRDLDQVAYQVVKYRQRNGWTHRDVLRKAHPKTDNPKLNSLFKYITTGKNPPEIDIVGRYEKARRAETEKEVIPLIGSGLTWEMIPNQFLKSPKIWDALLSSGIPMTALIRNLGRMTAIGLIAPLSVALKEVVRQLSDADRIRKARVHPIGVLSALKTYQSGAGVRGLMSWDPVGQVIDALNGAFYVSFGNITPTNKATLLALDVSGSMAWREIAGVPGLAPREASAAMAMVTARTEQHYGVIAFADSLIKVNITPNQRLDDVTRSISNLPFGETDCALPMIWALQNRVRVEAFYVYTDNETWAGKIHPSQALVKYRNKMDVPAKLVVVGMTATGFSIADPNDGGMMDVVGFDTATPNVMSDFVLQN